jgi:hypothetical protein
MGNLITEFMVRVKFLKEDLKGELETTQLQNGMGKIQEMGNLMTEFRKTGHGTQDPVASLDQINK